jgi:protein TonB
MNLPAHIPAQLIPQFKRPADRLGLTLLIAALVHLVVILGVGFSVAKPEQIRQTLEITLAPFKSATAPKQADFLAQDNQQGSGTLDKKALPKTTEVAPFQDNKINKVTPPPAARQKVEATPEPEKQAVTTIAPKTQKVEVKRTEVKTEQPPKAQTPASSSCMPNARASIA